MDKLPKVSIGIIAIVILQIGGFIFWVAQQASTISSLEESMAVLTAENTTSKRVNMERDILRNSEHLQEIIDILAEIYEEIEDGDTEIWEDIDQIHSDVEGLASSMVQIIKLQSRIALLEQTVEFTRKDAM